MYDYRGEIIHKRVLVIDDYSEFRYSVKKMLQSFGITDIDDVGDGDEAIEKMALKPYDIILCDYNLGEGKRDGQQILEEAKHRELLLYSSIFIMITAENTMAMVMGAMEYKPDDYLTKPFTKDALKSRIDKIMERKKEFEAIDKAVYHKDFLTAINICNERINNKPKNIFDYLRWKAQLCVMVGDYDEAKKIYEEVLIVRKIPWATLGLGKVLYLKAKFSDAIPLFKELIAENKTLMEAYDWLSKSYEELGESKEAQTVLMNASEISPKAILRQKSLAQIAMKNKDLNVAEKSLKAAVNLGKKSCFKSPTDYTGLANIYISRKRPDKALDILGDSRSTFTNNPEANLQAAVVEGLAYKEMGKPEAAQHALDEATQIFDFIKGSVSAEASMDVAKAFFALGDADKGNKIMENIIKNNHDNEKVIKMAEEVFNGANLHDEGMKIISDTKQEIVKVNNDGVALVQKGRLKDAIEFFEKAAAGLPDNKIINANAAQANIMYMQKYGKSERLMLQTRTYLEQIRKVDPSYAKYQGLLSMYQLLVSKQ
ncbi:MAG: response regulator [Nitrospirae bacterium]|nr:response regulator [Nitrospirota bacterium]MBF0592236.1 response regulator [Nitrospirota bacterium]